MTRRAVPYPNRLERAARVACCSGLFSSLTPEQQRKALAYRGDDSFVGVPAPSSMPGGISWPITRPADSGRYIAAPVIGLLAVIGALVGGVAWVAV